MLGVFDMGVHTLLYLGCLFVAAEVIKQLNIGRWFTKSTALVGFLLSLALGSLIYGPISYGVSKTLSLLTRYSGESWSLTLSNTVLGLVFLGGMLMLYNNWKKGK